MKQSKHKITPDWLTHETLDNAVANLVVPDLTAHARKAMRNISDPLTEHASDPIVGAKLASAILAVYAFGQHEHIRMTLTKTNVAVGPLLLQARNLR